MRLHRFFVKSAIKGSVVNVTDEPLLHQWKNVLRLQEGDSVILFNGTGTEVEGKFVTLSDNEAKVSIIKTRTTPDLAKNIRLCCAVLKRENFELVVQKAAEIGAMEIIPVITERTVKTGLKMERLEKIVREASEQCGRGTIPVVREPVSFESALKTYGADGLQLFFHVGSEDRSWQQRLNTAKDMTLWVGPEGGFTDAEAAIAQANGALICSLGGLALRAETAAIVATGLVIQGVTL